MRVERVVFDWRLWGRQALVRLKKERRGVGDIHWSKGLKWWVVWGGSGVSKAHLETRRDLADVLCAADDTCTGSPREAFIKHMQSLWRIRGSGKKVLLSVDGTGAVMIIISKCKGIAVAALMASHRWEVERLWQSEEVPRRRFPIWTPLFMEFETTSQPSSTKDNEFYLIFSPVFSKLWHTSKT